MPEQDAAYIQRNRNKLGRLVAVAPCGVAFLAAAGGSIDVFMALNAGNPFLAVFIVVADIAIGFWQGRLLGRDIAAQAAAPRSYGSNFWTIFFRGLTVGGLVGFINVVFFNERTFPLATISTVIGLVIGAGLGVMAGCAIGSYMCSLEKAPPPADAAQ